MSSLSHRKYVDAFGAGLHCLNPCCSRYVRDAVGDDNHVLGDTEPRPITRGEHLIGCNAAKVA